ncbi:LysR family transcriptional regulator [Nostoc linckia z16]|nr:LysR family transcriptional regulator [Nostoc linckia z16]
MNYTLNQLHVFLKIVQTESITKAAEELHLTQPAVSIQLKNFQAQFDIPLTEIIGRRIYITAFGKQIAKAAETIIEQVHAINYQSAAYKGQLSGRLKVSVVSTGKYVMPYFMSGFLNANPSVELIMDVTNKRNVIESLANNEVDFSLVSVLPPKMDVERIDLLKNKLFLAGNGKRTFESDKPDDVFKDLPIIIREEGSGTRQTMTEYLVRHNIPYIKKLELTSNEAVKQALISGMGYSVMPLIGIKNELSNGDLTIVPVKGLPITTTWSLIWLKGKNLSPVASAYLVYIKRHKEELIQEHFSWYERY